MAPTIAQNKLAIQQMVLAAQETARKRILEEKERKELAVRIQAEKELKQQEEFNALAIARFDYECDYPKNALLSIQDAKDVHIQKDSRFEWNAEQLRAIRLALDMQDFCLIGPAGTGKTTTERGLIQALVSSGKVPPLSIATKFLRQGSPALAIVSFTRRAVQAAKRQLSADLKNNCLTIHKLLEFEPIFFEVLDRDTGTMKKTMRFEPMRNAQNPITGLKLVIIDESSMCSVELYAMLKAACPNAIFIFVGDIQQLPPVYGSAILGFKMLELPVVELTQVYRQALESPIIRLAHRILSGKPIPPSELSQVEQRPELVFHLFKKRVESESALMANKKFFQSLCEKNLFNPDTDVILCPFNEAFGTLELNKAIAQKLGEMRGADVYEIISGFQKAYYAVGDRVLFDKQDGVIKEIVPNGLYVGKKPHNHSKNLNRWGNYIQKPTEEELADEGMDESQIERMLELTQSTEGEERKNQASHIIKVAPIIDGEELENFTWDLSTAGEVNSLLFSYALTVHKSQGSEWERVYFIMHHSHNTMCQREMLYTAVTRAKKYLYCICENRSSAGKEDSTFELGIRSQRIKGNTLAEKAEFFKGKLTEDMVGRIEYVSK